MTAAEMDAANAMVPAGGSASSNAGSDSTVTGRHGGREGLGSSDSGFSFLFLSFSMSVRDLDTIVIFSV